LQRYISDGDLADVEEGGGGKGEAAENPAAAVDYEALLAEAEAAKEEHRREMRDLHAGFHRVWRGCTS
jgi:hypothetical protein